MSVGSESLLDLAVARAVLELGCPVCIWAGFTSKLKLPGTGTALKLELLAAGAWLELELLAAGTAVELELLAAGSALELELLAPGAVPELELLAAGAVPELELLAASALLGFGLPVLGALGFCNRYRSGRFIPGMMLFRTY